MSCFMFSGGVAINVIKNEIDEASETGKVGGGIGRMEGDQIGTQIDPDVESVDCRGNEQESMGGGSISTVLVKTENVEDDDDDDDDEEEEEDDDDSDENDDEEEEDDDDDDGGGGNDNEMNGKRRKNLPCNSSETELGETKKFKEDTNEKREVV